MKSIPENTLLPSDCSAVSLGAQLYPVRWESDALYMASVKIRSEGILLDPVDKIDIIFDTPTSELIQNHFSSRGSAGNMNRAASPRSLEETSREETGREAQTYVGFFSGNNRTLSANSDVSVRRTTG
jgi:hypothetical protein